jgi:hypothetical protein
VSYYPAKVRCPLGIIYFRFLFRRILLVRMARHLSEFIRLLLALSRNSHLVSAVFCSPPAMPASLCCIVCFKSGLACEPEFCVCVWWWCAAAAVVAAAAAAALVHSNGGGLWCSLQFSIAHLDAARHRRRCRCDQRRAVAAAAATPEQAAASVCRCCSSKRAPVAAPSTAAAKAADGRKTAPKRAEAAAVQAPPPPCNRPSPPPSVKSVIIVPHRRRIDDTRSQNFLRSCVFLKQASELVCPTICVCAVRGVIALAAV